MCFSAEASFTAGVMLTVIGAKTLKQVHKPSQIVFASISLFFAFQQFAEGIVWTAMAYPGHAGLQRIASYVFVLMAQVLWPVLIPFSVLLMEEDKTRKKILLALTAAGAAVAAYFLYRLMSYGVYAGVFGRHITYQNSVRDYFAKTALIFYLFATLLPLFVSSIKRMWILGLIMTLSFVAAFVFYTRCLISVWCFFAALISFMVYYIIRDSHKKFHLKTT